MERLWDAVDELLADGVRELPAPALSERITELDGQITRLQSAYLSALEAFDQSGAAMAQHGSTQAWLFDATISVEHAQLIASLKRCISDDALAAAEPHLVEAAQRCTPTELRGFVAHVRHSYAPDKARADD